MCFLFVHKVFVLNHDFIACWRDCFCLRPSPWQAYTISSELWKRPIFIGCLSALAKNSLPTKFTSTIARRRLWCRNGISQATKPKRGQSGAFRIKGGTLLLISAKRWGCHSQAQTANCWTFSSLRSNTCIYTHMCAPCPALGRRYIFIDIHMQWHCV